MLLPFPHPHAPGEAARRLPPSIPGTEGRSGAAGAGAGGRGAAGSALPAGPGGAAAAGGGGSAAAQEPRRSRGRAAQQVRGVRAAGGEHRDGDGERGALGETPRLGPLQPRGASSRPLRGVWGPGELAGMRRCTAAPGPR